MYLLGGIVLSMAYSIDLYAINLKKKNVPEKICSSFNDELSHQASHTGGGGVKS